MNNPFHLDFEPLFRDHGSAVERATLAQLVVTVDDVVVTRLEDVLAKTVRQEARLSTFRLAQWFAANWWRLRWEPERASLSWKMSHQIGTVGGGYVWPDLTFASDGSTVKVRSRPTSEISIHPIRYLVHTDLVIHANAFEDGVSRFIEGVIARLASQSIAAPELTDLWKEVQEEQRDPEFATWRKLEAILGFDPDEAPQGLIEQLKAAGLAHGKGAIEELAANSMSNTPTDLDIILGIGKLKLPQFSISSVVSLRESILQAGDASMYPWLRAERAAASARNVWGIQSGPVKTARLAEIFEVPESQVQQQESPGPTPISIGYRDNGKKIRMFLAQRHPAGRRFALARLVGDHLVADPSERLLPATIAKTARQKFQRAFAQEFLCPFGELMEFLGGEPISDPGDERIEDAANHFDVSPYVIATTLVNKGFLNRATLQS